MTDPERVEHATRSFLDDRPDHEETIETLLTHEQEHESWKFDDASVDSGTFGELVSRQFVEETPDGNYRFVDPQAVRAALDDDSTYNKDATQNTEKTLNLSVLTLDRWALAGLLGALATFVVTRSLFFGSVFRNGRVVSPANDPYFYRYYQERFLEQSDGLLDVSMLGTVGEETTVRPLTHALNWWFTELIGGTQDAAGTVAAWQPIVASVLSGLVLYFLIDRLTGDRRIALAALLFLALTPVHVVYTSLGFLEHRLYQYLWLTVLAFALVWLAADLKRRLRTEGSSDASSTHPKTAVINHVRAPRTWVITGILGVAVATSAHAWGGSPLTFIPVALYLGIRVLLDVKADISPAIANIPALVGIGSGTLLAVIFHVQFNWHESIAVTVPALVTAGGVAVVFLATVWRRLEFPPAALLVVEGVLAVIGGWAFRRFRPEDVSRLQERADALFGREGITETTSLFAADQAIILKPLFQIGFGFYLGLVTLVFVTWYVTRRYEPGWLVLVCFGWTYMILAAFQVRFAAQLSIFIAVFAGVSLVYLLGAIDLVRRPTLFESEDNDARVTISLPDRSKAIYLVGVVGLVFLLNLIFVPSLLGQIQHNDGGFDATTTITAHNESTGYGHPDYVLSQWGDNRMYNYFVSGESSSYAYARVNYEGFISSQNPDKQYSDLAGRVGYVVLTDVEASEETTQHKLFNDLGAGNDSLAHYQLLYASADVRAFALVRGAVINVTAEPGTNVTAQTSVTTGGRSFTYRRTATATDNGILEIRVAYPGEYDVGNTTVMVSERDIYEGRVVSSNN